jgi:general nucleoside transport system ATP-binding protein
MDLDPPGAQRFRGGHSAGHGGTGNAAAASGGKRDCGGEAVLALSGVTMTTASGRRHLDDVGFSIAAGEVLGVAGVDGNGQTELSEAASGLAAIQGGSIVLNGRDVTRASVRERRRAGLSFVPEDRLDRGLSASMSVSENLCASLYRSKRIVGPGGLLRGKAREAFVSATLRRFDVRGASPSLPVGRLSGGNMQKIVIPRELERDPAALIVAQPTRGLDVGATEFVHGRFSPRPTGVAQFF